MIVTASTNILLSDRIKFDGGLPKRQLDALEKLKLGSFDHVALELSGNVLGLQRDDLVFEKSSGPRTAALLANVGGSPLSVVEVAGRSAAISPRRAKRRWSNSRWSGSPACSAPT